MHLCRSTWQAQALRVALLCAALLSSSYPADKASMLLQTAAARLLSILSRPEQLKCWSTGLLPCICSLECIELATIKLSHDAPAFAHLLLVEVRKLDLAVMALSMAVRSAAGLHASLPSTSHALCSSSCMKSYTASRSRVLSPSLRLATPARCKSPMNASSSGIDTLILPTTCCIMKLLLCRS